MSKKTLMDQALGDYFDSLFGDDSSELESKSPISESNASSEQVRNKIREQRNRLQVQAKPLEALFEQAQKPVQVAQPETLPQVLPVFKAETDIVPDTQSIAIESNEIVAAPIEVPIDEPVISAQASLDLETQTQTSLEPEATAEPSWTNVETEESFQALFFEVAGVVFGVPLTELGGIHRITEISPLFGKPDWFGGIMLERERKLNAVDTVKWVMPGQNIDAKYEYMVMLGDSQWGLECEQLRGTEWLNRDDVKWRANAGERPWLAGMVKNKMCALLHVEEMVQMLNSGINIEGH